MEELKLLRGKLKELRKKVEEFEEEVKKRFKLLDEEENKSKKDRERRIKEMEIIKGKVAEMEIELEVRELQIKEENKAVKLNGEEQEKEESENLGKRSFVERGSEGYSEREDRGKIGRWLMLRRLTGEDWNWDVLKIWMKEKVKGDWTVEKASDYKDVVWVSIEEKAEWEKVWQQRRKIREEEDILIDEWLPFEVRRRRYFLIEKAQEMRAQMTTEGRYEEIVVERDVMKVGDRIFCWDEEEEDIREIKKGRKSEKI